jgi:WD40 repeat protein
VKRLGTTRFLAVVGPSGSGKSSVVRAGLLPAIRRGDIPTSESWWIADMFPGARPLDGLEAALLRAAPDPPSSLMEQLQRDEHGLHRAVLRLLPSDGSELVLVIDQFEEVFTLVEDEHARTHFLGSLEAAATDPHSRLRVVATLRADFYDRPLLYRGFADLFKSRVEALVPLSPEELERAISGPAKRVDVSLEPGLVAAMLADVAEKPGGLPLMEYALTELFDRRDGRTLFLEAYRQIGGVSGALGRRAEEVYNELDAGKEAARQLFLRLVALGEGTEDTRRRVPRAEVASLDLDQHSMTTVLDRFGVSRLLSFDRDGGTGAPTIELAHEAILTAWPRLHRWIDAAREELRTERRVAAAAREWTESDRDPSFLLSGSRLEQAETWRAGSGIAITPEEREYLDASREQRDRALAEERARQAHEEELERRSFRRLRALVAVLAAASVVAIGLTVFALTQSRRAETESRTAVARELAAASVASLDSDPERSVLLALEAIDHTRSVDGTVLPEAREALHRAVTASRIVRFEPGIGGAVDWSPNGVFVTEGPEDSGEVEIRDVETGDPVLTFHGHDVDLNEPLFSPDGSMLATGGDDGFLKVWDPTTGERIASLEGEGRVLGVSFSGDGSFVAAAWPDEGLVRIMDPVANRLIRTIDARDQFPSETALSPDGRSIAVGPGAINFATVYDVSSGQPRFELLGHRFPINAIAWSPDGRRIATGGNDSSVRIYDGRTGRSQLELLGNAGPVISVDWDPDGQRLLTGSSDGTARVWDVAEERGQELMLLSSQGTRSGVWAVFSPDGDHVLTGDFDITAATIWDVSVAGDAEWTNVPTDPLVPVDVAFLRGGQVVASSDGNAVTVWDVIGEGSARPVRTLGPGSGSREPIVRIAANHDGTRVATARGFSSIADVWNAGTGTRMFKVTTADGGENSDLTWSPDGRWLVFTDYGGGAVIYDPAGDRVGAFHLPDQFGIEAAAFGPDGRLVATADTSYESPERATITIRDWEGERVVHRIPNRGGASQLAFSPSGDKLALAGFDGFVDILSVDSGERLLRFPANEGPVNDIAYSPDGSTIATAGDDGTARLFDAEEGTQLLVLRGHRLHVSGIAFSPDGTRLASASADATVRIWALDLDDLIRIAHQQVTREFTDDECRQYLHLDDGCA